MSITMTAFHVRSQYYAPIRHVVFLQHNITMEKNVIC